MPRTRKRTTTTGRPALPPAEIPPQTYGQGAPATAMQAAMPTPDARALPPAAPPGPPTAQPVSQQAPPDIGTLLERARGQGAGAGLLLQPSTRPNEPVTAGLPLGPGPGPEALGHISSTPFGRTLRKLAQRIGDPYFAELADRNGI